MICKNCGKELPEEALFCSRCGMATETGTPSETTFPTETETTTEITVPAEKCGTEPEPAPVIPSAEKLILRKGKIFADSSRLTIDGKYYTKKTKRQKFKRKTGLVTVPFSSVTSVSRRHDRYGRRIAAFLLLFIVFTCGCLAGGFLTRNTWNDLNTPYRATKIAELEKSLKRLEGGGADEQASLDAERDSVTEEIRELEELLAQYRNGRREEVLKAATESEEFSVQNLLESDFFKTAWEQYITDLLAAFKADEHIDSWLYPYYTYSVEKGFNTYIEEDLWVYDNYGNENEKFSSGLGDYNTFWWTCYDYSLYDHLSRDGRIYITAADFLDFVLYLQDYAVNGAVFVTAYGGSPNPADMSVPGWASEDYDSFWENADDYYYSSSPVWLDYGLSAKDFELDWNQLVDERAFYKAYKKLMDTIAPGLPCYDMAEYYGSDNAFGGMGYELRGKEASMNRIAALYLENNPSYLKTLGIDVDSMSSSYDDRIEEAELALDELTAQLTDLEVRQTELTAFLESGEDLHRDYDALQAEIAERETTLRRNLVIFSGITVFLFLIALFCLYKFIGFLKRPRRLFVMTQATTDIAFNTRHCPEEALEELERRFPC